jgi:signal transduction histidine kinase
LFIAKQIALAHGGIIVAHSDERAGTVFAVTVPRS